MSNAGIDIAHAVLHSPLFIPGTIGQLPATLEKLGNAKTKSAKMTLLEGFLKVEISNVSVLIPLTNVIYMKPTEQSK